MKKFKSSSEPSKKKKKSKKPIAEDRISALPDGLLCHILSCIEPEYIKCVVSTSTLSKRWKNLWAYVPSLCFENHGIPSSVNFLAFVDRALLIGDSATIQKFLLHFDGRRTNDLGRIPDWINTAVKCNVVELDLEVELYGRKTFELPESLLTCETLRVLKLWLNPLLVIPKAGCWPSLKVLHLNVTYPDLINQDNNLMYFSQFPVLEYLSIEGYFGVKSFTFIIFGPELKTLRINAKITRQDNIRVAHVFPINAPKLEMLDVQDEFLSHYSFVNPRSLVEANVCASSDGADEFLEGISTVKYLTISSRFLEACSVHVFDNLRELKVVIKSFFKWSLLTEVMGGIPNLESLVLEFEGYYEPLCGDHGDYVPMGYRGEFADVLRWSPPESVPNCLVSHLKTICIKGFKRSRDAKEVINYLLENGQVLQKMTVHSPGIFVGADRLDNQLPTLETVSETYRVESITKVACHCLFYMQTVIYEVLEPSTLM